MSEEEHTKILNELYEKYIGKKIIVEDEDEPLEVIVVHVDYRKDRQDMNRVEDEYGGIWRLDEIKEVISNENKSRNVRLCQR